MDKLRIILVLNILLFAGMFASGSVPIERIGLDANWFAQFDCGLFLKSVSGEAIKKHLTELDVEKRLEDFAIYFGFNPLEDVQNVMLYGQGNDRDKAVLLIEGKFNKERLLALVGMNAEFKEIVYDDITIQQWRETDKNVQQSAEGRMIYGCFFRDDLIMLCSGLSCLKDAIDVMKGTRKSTSEEIFKDSLLLDSNVFLHIAAKDIAQLLGDEPNAAVLKQTEQIIIGVGQDSENIFACVKLKAKSQETARNISKLVDGIIALLSLAGDEQPELAKIGQMIKLTTDYDKVEIRLELEPALVQQIIENNTGKI
ncbi:MAG: hypothetical protein JXA96_10170 [Sedimentisphaerales bacterium]|nr:hypothetical protein [Sedimentisphaerales bacterium]